MIWTTIFLCGLVTFLIRFVPLSGVLTKEIPPFLKDTFKYIPLAVLTPIIVNDLSIIENNNLYLMDNYKLYSAIVAIVVAIVSNNVFVTIFVGMASFLIMSNFSNI